jgi:adenosine deaminase
VTDSAKVPELKAMLEASLLATVNSDDPAYFAAYLNENFRAVAAHGAISRDDLVRLARNSFEIAWLDAGERAAYLALIDSYAAR